MKARATAGFGTAFGPCPLALLAFGFGMPEEQGSQCHEHTAIKRCIQACFGLMEVTFESDPLFGCTLQVANYLSFPKHLGAKSSQCERFFKEASPAALTTTGLPPATSGLILPDRWRIRARRPRNHPSVPEKPGGEPHVLWTLGSGSGRSSK